MRQSNAKDLFLNSSFPSVETHQFRPFRQGSIDVKMPSPNADIRLFIFKPVDYPYLWVQYLNGLKREYSRMRVDHILDMSMLSNPASTDLGMLAIVDGEIVSGIRFHKGVKKAENATVYKEMMGGNTDLLKEYLEKWIPEGIVEPKGLWLTPQSQARKRLLPLMARCGIYGAALLDCRYTVCTSPKHITRMHVDIGMRVIEEIGCVEYPTKDYKTTFGYCDLQEVLDLCDEQNRLLLRRDWQQIHYTRLNTPKQSWTEQGYVPLIFDEENPFHSTAIESLLLDGNITQHHQYQSIQSELNELLPTASNELKAESKRWVVYPWKNVALEIPGPKSFKKLRTDRNRNKITDDEQQQLSQISVGVVGLSTGHVIAHTLIMEGACGHLKLADFDVLEVSNLNRIPASLIDIGVNKAVIAARKIAELDPYVPIDIYEQGLTSSNIEDFMSGLDIVIEECDSLDVKVLVREAAIKLKIPVLMATSDLGMMDVERFDLDKNAKPFHGLTDVSASKLKDLSRRDKSGYALAIVEGEKISARLAASMIEIDHTVSTWSQLASDVTQGAAMAVTAVRRIATHQAMPSSRVRMDIEACFAQGKKPEIPELQQYKTTSAPEFTGDLKADMLLAATYAPSPGNIQPWNIYWQGDVFHIEIDRQRTTSMDVKHRGAMVAIGAACLNAEIVAAHFDQAITVHSFASEDNPDLVVQIHLNNNEVVNERLKGLYPWLLSRVTNRERTSRRKIPADVMTELGSVSQLYSVELHSLSTQTQLNDYADIAAESDRLRHLSQNLHQEMIKELVWPGINSLETGIDVRTLGLKDKELNALPVLARRDVMEEVAKVNGGTSLGHYNRERITEAAAMVVPTIKGQENKDYFIGGKALQHFWLIADSNHLSIQPISPVFLYANTRDERQTLMKGEYLEETTALQQQFRELLKIDEEVFPVLALRVTYAPEAKYRSLRENNNT